MEPVVSAKQIVKSFSGVTVLKNVDFDIYPGEVHAMVGENGAGKSTLMKVISGVYQPTAGQLYLKGEKVAFKTPHAAREKGISLIHQEPLTFQDLNVVENIYLGHTRGGRKPFINWRQKSAEAADILDGLGVALKPTDPVQGMPIAKQQMIEIASALSQNARVIIMDEPTAALSSGEVRTLFELINRLKADGKAIVFIGHRLEEVLEISDRITVLRDGELVGEVMAKDVTQDQLVQMMIGRTMEELIVKETVPFGDVMLETRNLTKAGQYYDVNIKVRAGEIVGMSGLVGAGRSEVASAVFGIEPPESGQIFIKGKEVRIKNVEEGMKQGMAMVTEDRARTGLLLTQPVKNNMTYAFLQNICKGGFVNNKKEDEICEEYTKELSIKITGGNQAVQELSGGNQQKVVLAKWLVTHPDILILDEPTRGIDVGAKAEVYTLIAELVKQGKAILMISSELEEILQLSDRVYVMAEGYVTAEFSREEMDSFKIMQAATNTGRGKIEDEVV